jgi:hypothetical protein
MTIEEIDATACATAAWDRRGVHHLEVETF